MKKGFTLIELLAVIVILAVIALIATPIVLNIINNTKESAAIRSVDGYVRALNYTIAENALHDVVVEDGEYIIGENELQVEGNNVDRITMGSYEIINGVVAWAGLCVDNYPVEYNSATGYRGISTTNYCSDGTEVVFVEPEGILLKEVYADETKYSETYFKIKTLEDLVAFSALVNGGKNFSGKTIYLVSDLDFNSDSSYSNTSSTIYGDINGNGTVEGLKTELTTGGGFTPIGNNSNKFSGTFIGYAFTISNLMINRPSTNYVSLFGYNEGIINGIKIRNTSITGDDYVSGIVGYNNAGIIKNVDVVAVITGDGYVGGIIGEINNGTLVDAIFSGNVSGRSSIAGLIGNRKSGTTSGVIYNTTVTASTNSAGLISTNNSMTAKTYNSTITPASGRSWYYDGTKITIFTLESVDDIIDTMIGGDSNLDGYYFDYNGDNIELYSIDRTPIKSLKGEGTEENPYLITSEKDWNLAVATIDATPHYYSLTSDLDFTNKNFITIGNSTNKFNGVFLGNNHTISNATIAGNGYVGIFGYNTGTIKDINFNNISITNYANYTGLIATNEGTIDGIKARNLVISGNGYTGGLTGYNTNNGVMKNIDIHATITSNNTDTTYSGRYVGGLVGSHNNGQLVNAVFSGSVEGTNNIAGIIGYRNNGTTSAVIYNSTVTSTGNAGLVSTYNSMTAKAYNSTVTSTGHSWCYDGTTIQSLTLETVNDILDINDSDSDGYYFDLVNGELELIKAN